MLATVNSGAVFGLDAIPVTVEVEYNPYAMTSFTIAGLLVLRCGWLDSSPHEHPLQLIEMRQCTEAVLSYLYAHVPARVPKISKKERDTKIFALHMQGVSNDAIAKQFRLSIKDIERIIRDSRA